MLNGTEALFGFVAWLSGRAEVVKLGGSEICAGWPELIRAFADANNLPPVRDDVYPAELHMPPAD